MSAPSIPLSWFPAACGMCSQIYIATKVLGEQLDWPVMLSPIGFGGLFYHHGELAAARAVNNRGDTLSLQFGCLTRDGRQCRVGGDQGCRTTR